MIFLSDEDTNIAGLVNAWISRRPEEKQETLKRLIEEMFFKAVDWCVKANDAVLETSLVGLVLNGLSHLAGASNRLQFAVALVRGLGGNLMPGTRENFAKEVTVPPNADKVFLGVGLVRGVGAEQEPTSGFLQFQQRQAGGIF